MASLLTQKLRQENEPSLAEVLRENFIATVAHKKLEELSVMEWPQPMREIWSLKNANRRIA